MKKLLSLVLFAVFFVMETGGVALATGAVLPNNTPVEIQAVNTYEPSMLSVGDTVKFATLKNITLNGKTVIAAGAPVTATVQKATALGRIGKPAEIILDDFSTVTVNGTKVPLSGSINQRGKSKIGLSIALSVCIIPFFLLMKGKDTAIEQGYQTTVYTASAVGL